MRKMKNLAFWFMYFKAYLVKYCVLILMICVKSYKETRRGG